MKKIVLGISGSIASYKSIELAKQLESHGFNVKIVLSRSAPDFVSVLTLRALFPGKIYLADDALSSLDQMLHIQLAKEADLILIAPASANTIAALSNGLANCLLTQLCLASKAPLAIAPAMNREMWTHPSVRHNVATLKSRGAHVLGPAVGIQACGDFGPGRLVKTQTILDHVQKIFTPKLLENRRVVITAGATREKIDPVRFLSNCSSGKMGVSLAKAAHAMGAELTLICTHADLSVPDAIKVVLVESADDMLEASRQHAKNAELFIGAAAVSDYKPITGHVHKLKKHAEVLTLELKKNSDIIQTLKCEYPHLFCVGFAAETQNFEANALEKLRAKKLDMMVLNDVSGGKVFGKDFNEVQIFTENRPPIKIPRANKNSVAAQILKQVHGEILKQR